MTNNQTGSQTLHSGERNYTLDSFVRARYSMLAKRQARGPCARLVSMTRMHPYFHLASLAATQTDNLAVLLQLGNELVTLLHDVVVPEISCQYGYFFPRTRRYSLLVLIIGSLGLNHALHTVDRARQPLTGDERRQVLVEPRDTDAE